MSNGKDIQLVTFGLDKEVFAVPVGVVREILDHAPAFRIPSGPDWLLGLTDVRGQGVPTVDLRLRLGLNRVETTSDTRILIVDVSHGERVLALGLVVDRVLTVSAVPADAVEPAPDIGIRWRSGYIQGVVRQDGGFMLLLNLAKLFSTDEAALLPKAA